MIVRTQPSISFVGTANVIASAVPLMTASASAPAGGSVIAPAALYSVMTRARPAITKSAVVCGGVDCAKSDAVPATTLVTARVGLRQRARLAPEHRNLQTGGDVEPLATSSFRPDADLVADRDAGRRSDGNLRIGFEDGSGECGQNE